MPLAVLSRPGATELGITRRRKAFARPSCALSGTFEYSLVQRRSLLPRTELF